VIGELERSGGQYQREVAQFFLRRLRPDAVAVDGGAHIGVLTVLLASLCRHGHVYAFEPAPQNLAHLRANVAANRAQNVTVVEAALFDRDGELTMSFDEAYPGGTHVGAGSSPVRSVRLDTWVAEQGLDRLDLLKLDVEGVELTVLDGAADTIERLRPITVVECNPVALPRFGGTDHRRLFGRLRELFPLVAQIMEGGALVPLLKDEHLDLALRHHGVIDLVGIPDMAMEADPAAADRLALTVVRAKGRVAAARLRTTHNRWRAPAENFVVDPGAIELRPGPAHLDGKPAETLTVPLHVRNGSGSWLSSQFPHEPVHVSYRWNDEAGVRVVDEGHRTPFPRPVGPGHEVTLDAIVQLPGAAGKYELVFTLVQEHFAWLDEIDAGCTARIPAVVTAP